MSEWVSIAVVCPEFADEQKTKQRRAEVMGLIASGLMKAQAFRQKIRLEKFPKDDDLEIFCEFAKKGVLVRCNFPWSGELAIDKNLEETEVSFHTIYGIQMFSSEHWISSRSDDFSIKQSKADWELGHFQLRSLYYAGRDYGGPEAVGFIYSQADVFALEVQPEAVRRLLGVPASDVTQSNGRATKYDWEAAFADVAAAFYHDVVFQSLEARGVQTEIVDLLRNSFEKRGVSVPSDDTLKPKARMLLGALRAKKPQ